MRVGAPSRLHTTAICVVAGVSAFACADAVCPAGTVEVGGHCVQDASAGSSAPENPPATQGNAGPGTAGIETKSDANVREVASGNASGSGGGQSADGQSAKPPAGGAGTPGNVAGTEAPPRAGRGAETPASPVCGNGKIEGTELCDGNCPEVSNCSSPQACLSPVLAGSAATCDARCDLDPVTKCESGDDCCPSGCKYPDDTDCSKSCGDGVVDPPETCEPNNADMPCPVECDDGMDCTKDVLSGSAEQCSARCMHVPIVAPAPGDRCCPPNANANNDSDCEPKCGNGVKEANETCDGNCPTSCPRPGDSCTIAEPTGSGCNVKCTERKLTASRTSTDGCCPNGANANTDRDCQPKCGNGVTEPGETCDADCPATCADPPDPCVRAVRQGSACNYRCVNEDVRASKGAKDGCCPSGADSNTDSDCQPDCGNGQLDPGENCEIAGPQAYALGTCDPNTCTLTESAYGPCTDAMTMPLCPQNAQTWFCAPTGECSRHCVSDDECKTSAGRGYCMRSGGDGFCAIACGGCPFGHRCVNFNDQAMICGSTNWTAARGPFQ